MPSPCCTICGQHAELSCAGCMASSYCSRACQTKDWALHSLLCQEYTQILHSRPADTDFSTFKLGIIFPEDSKYPQLIWIECELRGFDHHHHQVVIYNHLPPGELEVFRKYYHDHSLELCMDRSPSTWIQDTYHESKPNQCLGHLMRGYETRDRACDMAYLSPVVIVGYTQQLDEFNTKRYQDITLADLRHALNFFARNVVVFEGAQENPYVVRYGTTWVKAAKISCDGDMRWKGERKYRQVEIRRDYSIFEQHSDISQISRRMGIPLRVQKCGIDKSWFEANTFNSFFNRQVESLMLPVENDVWYLEDTSGWHRDFAQTVLVARQDKRDLTARQLEAFAKYCREFVEPAMLGPSGLGDHLDKEGRQHVAKNYMCREPFEVFLLEIKLSKRAEGDNSWDRTISPYEVGGSKAEPAWDNKMYAVAPMNLYFDSERPAEVQLDYG